MFWILPEDLIVENIIFLKNVVIVGAQTHPIWPVPQPTWYGSKGPADLGQEYDFWPAAPPVQEELTLLS